MDQSRQFPLPGQNRLLAALPRELQLRLLPRMERVSLPVRQLLYEPDAPIAWVYFPVGCVVSLVVPMKSGPGVEVGTIGSEGVVGTQALLGAPVSSFRVQSQVAGQALRMRVDAFRRAVEEVPELGEIVRRYAQATIEMIARAAACNHVHSVEQRMCRWLLVTQDRVGSDEFNLTQEFLAQMLCVRRPSVTVAAGELQKQGLIRYHRGRIRVADRPALEAHACECYGSARMQLERLLH